MRAKHYNQTYVSRTEGFGFVFLPYTQKIENAEASLNEDLPCCCVCKSVQQARRKQSTVVERLS